MPSASSAAPRCGRRGSRPTAVGCVEASGTRFLHQSAARLGEALQALVDELARFLRPIALSEPELLAGATQVGHRLEERYACGDVGRHDPEVLVEKRRGE